MKNNTDEIFGEDSMPMPDKLSTGYWYVRLGPNSFAQWPQGERLERKHVFQPEWNWKEFEAWRDWWESRTDLT